MVLFLWEFIPIEAITQPRFMRFAFFASNNKQERLEFLSQFNIAGRVGILGLIYQDAWIRAKPTPGKECSIPLFDWRPSGRKGSAALPSPRDSLLFSADDGSYSACRPAGGSSVPATIKRWGRKWLLLGHG